MKHNNIFFIAVLLITLLLCISSAQADVTDLGDLCLSLDRDGSFGPGSGLRVGILFYGLDHFALNGIIDGQPAYGTVLINSDNAIMSLTASNVATSVNMFSVYHIALDLTTGTGTYKQIVTKTLPAPSQSGTISGTVTLSTCSQ